jgi:rhodanese-related sulfurtransferase
MTITTEELKEMIDNKEDYILIDVRNKEELEHGMIPTAKHLYLDEIEEAFKLSEEEFENKYNFKKPSKEKLIILHCRTGARSQAATDFLIDRGYNAKNYQGSVQAWSLIDENVHMY